MMSAVEFKRQLMSLSLAVSFATLALIAGYLHLLLRLSSAMWQGFYVIVGIGFVLLFVLTQIVSRRMVAPILECLSAEEQKGMTREQLLVGFRSLSGFPLWSAIVGCCWWSGGGLLVALAMKVCFPAAPLYPLFVMWLAATSGGAASSVALYFLSKDRWSGLLDLLADRIGDVEERKKRTVRVSLRQKVTVSVTAVTLVVVGFGVALSLSKSGDRLEGNAVRVQRAYLRDLGSRSIGEGLRAAAERARRLAVANDLVRLDVESGTVLDGPEDLLSTEEKNWVIAAREGDSLGISSPNVFAWVTLREKAGVLVAVTPWPELGEAASGFGTTFVATMMISGLLVFGLAALVSRDVERRTAELADVVERVGSGDLRKGMAIESEDELGDLARAFEEMAAGLRHTVGEVAGATDVVDGVAGELSELAHDVAQGAAV